VAGARGRRSARFPSGKPAFCAILLEEKLDGRNGNDIDSPYRTKDDHQVGRHRPFFPSGRAPRRTAVPDHERHDSGTCRKAKKFPKQSFGSFFDSIDPPSVMEGGGFAGIHSYYGWKNAS